MSGLVIIGSSGHCKVVIDIAERQGNYKIVGLIDSFRPVGESTMGYPIIGSIEDLPALVSNRSMNLTACFVAIGDNWKRYQVVTKVRELCPDLEFPTLTHPSALLAREARLGSGTVVMAGAVVNSATRVNSFCILNTGCSLDHDCEMFEFGSLGPRVCTGGGVRIGAYSAVGIGVVISHGVTIGSSTVVGAGATVLKDLPDHCVAYGTPARVIRRREDGEKYL